jgi:hypothetical protein
MSIKRYRLAWAWITLALYVVAVPFTIIVFPENSLWLGLLILFSGYTTLFRSTPSRTTPRPG